VIPLLERPHHRRDLAMMKPALPLLRRAVAKAKGAHGEAIRRDLQRAIERMGERTGWLERCTQVMGTSPMRRRCCGNACGR
jgi:hypothetical protein